MKNEFMIHVTSTTMIGVNTNNFPVNDGNCFSARTSIDNEYRIVNFCLENLEEVIRRGITYPIKIRPISERIAVIHDCRIPAIWYQKDFCEVCCPEHLLPLPQRLAHDRQIESGERTIIKTKDMRIIKVDFSKAAHLPDEPQQLPKVRKLKTGWKLEQAKDIVVGAGKEVGDEILKSLKKQIKKESFEKDMWKKYGIIFPKNKNLKMEAFMKVTKDQLIKLQKALGTDQAIAAKLTVTRQAVHQMRNHYGIPSLIAENSKRNKEIIALYKMGTTGTSIAKKYDISVSQAYRIIAAGK